RSDVAVKVYGDGMDTLGEVGANIEATLTAVPGASDVTLEQTTGLPVLTIQIDRMTIARLGLNMADVQEVVAVAVGGRVAGQVFEGDRRFDLLVRLPEALRTDLDALKRLPISLPTGQGFVPLGQVASFEIAPGPNQISRENGKRRVVVTANVRGRDIGSFVADAERRIAENVEVPAGYWTTWGGQFEQLLSARQRLQVVVPLALTLIFALLFVTFGNFRDALLV